VAAAVYHKDIRGPSIRTAGRCAGGAAPGRPRGPLPAERVQIKVFFDTPPQAQDGLGVQLGDP